MPQLMELARLCFGSSAWGESHFAFRPGRVVWVAESGDAGPVGYCVVECVADEAELQAVAVADNWRRHGVGAALLSAARASAQQRGAQQVYLEVRESNDAAQAFYRRFGFAVSGRRPSYYRDPPEAALLMSAPVV
ncbi:MAG TPA: ribosomal protein S18-alanine N-acetyltransferase [Terriglobales bacterium]|nr:ribosomal protein S18-alanine N-acetyltransferase [Terriglobales bacterium]